MSNNKLTLPRLERLLFEACDISAGKKGGEFYTPSEVARLLAPTGELRRFDRVTANPPFSQNYSRADMKFKDRCQIFMPEKGKKADLMFVQHMLAVLKADGKLAVVWTAWPRIGRAIRGCESSSSHPRVKPMSPISQPGVQPLDPTTDTSISQRRRTGSS